MFNKKLFFWIIILINFLAAIYGFIFYYGKQLLSTPLPLTVFVPDCPLAALLFSLALLFLYFKKKWNWFYFLTFALSLKYGFWTVFVLANYASFYFSPEFALLYSVLFVAHILIFLEQFVLLGKIELKKWHLLPALSYLLANDFSDYLFYTHPPLPDSALSFMFPATTAMTLFFVFFSYIIISKWKKPLMNVFYN